MTIRFDDAWQGARQVAEEVARGGRDVVLVRDLTGRISLILDDRASALPSEDQASIERRLSAVAGPFAAAMPTLLASGLFAPEVFLDSSDLGLVEDRRIGRGRLRTADRGAVGGDWTTTPKASDKRVTLYGFKGGVGRSTATFLLARHLASEGRCVLVVDLDLESPGVGALLQHEANLPEFGLVDYLVEAAVGNEAGVDLVVRSQIIEPVGNGEVWVAPASGRPRRGYDYIAKLNRVYVDLPAGAEGDHGLRFADRIHAAVEACEAEVARRSRTPEVVLLDSRAGVHDLAAVAITRLSGYSLLFAMDNPQTWTGYRALFRQWGRIPELARTMRDRIQMVASFVPPGGGEGEYLSGFRDRAQACLAETLYDDAASDDPDAYNPAPADDSAPHAPLPIVYTGELVGLDHVRSPNWYSSTLVNAAYERFVRGAAEFVRGEP